MAGPVSRNHSNTMTWHHRPLFVFDVQTSGRSAATDQILEISYCLSHSPSYSPSYSTDQEPLQKPALMFGDIITKRVRLRAGTTLSPQITKMLGLTEVDLAHGISELELWQVLKQELQTLGNDPARPILVAHYLQFEKSFLQRLVENFSAVDAKTESIKSAGCTEGAGDKILDSFDSFCSQRAGKKLFPEFPSHTLKAFAGQLHLPTMSLKDSKTHLITTLKILQLITTKAEANDISNWDDLFSWLQQPRLPKEPIKKYQFQIPREQRLQLPDLPGVYVMHSADNKVLYIGKATSLRSRVNSYFRGLKGLEARKREMLSQIHHIETQICSSPLAAAICESDLIKTHNPPYNISLKAEQRRLIYYSTNFETLSGKASSQTPIGPLQPNNALEQLRDLYLGVEAQTIAAAFYNLYEEEALQEAWLRFLQYYQVHLLPSEEPLPKNLFCAFELCCRLYNHHSSALKSGSELELEVEELAQKILRVHLRAAHEMHKLLQLIALANSILIYSNPRHGKPLVYKMTNSQFSICGDTCAQTLPAQDLSELASAYLVPSKMCDFFLAKQELISRLDVAALDRLRILYSETTLNKNKMAISVQDF